MPVMLGFMRGAVETSQTGVYCTATAFKAMDCAQRQLMGDIIIDLWASFMRYNTMWPGDPMMTRLQ